jgi:hypothetical protein
MIKLVFLTLMSVFIASVGHAATQSVTQNASCVTQNTDYDGDYVSSTSSDKCSSAVSHVQVHRITSKSIRVDKALKQTKAAVPRVIETRWLVSWQAKHDRGIGASQGSSELDSELFEAKQGLVSNKTDAAANLLLSSYALSQQLQDSERLYYLTELTRASVGILPPDKTLEWCRTLFRIASESRDPMIQAAGEKNSLIPLSSIDPKMAMRLLLSVAIPDRNRADILAEDVRTDAAEAIFDHFWNHFQGQGLREIENTARYLGNTGQYPYHAVANIIEQLAKIRTPETSLEANKIFAEALSFYGKEEGFRNRDEEFLHFLQSRGLTIIDSELVIRALRLFASRLSERDPYDDANYYGEIHTSRGVVVPFHNRNRAFLFLVAPVIREFDAKFVQELTLRYSELKQAIGKMHYVSGGFIFDNPTPSEAAERHLKWLQESLVSQIKISQNSDPSDAAQLALRLRDIDMQIALLSAGSKMNGVSTEAALPFKSLRKPQDRLDALVARAKSAYFVGDMDHFSTLSDQAVDMGFSLLMDNSHQVSRPRIQRLQGYEQLADIIEFGTVHGSVSLMARVQQIPNPELKAYLLIRVAEGILK